MPLTQQKTELLIVPGTKLGETDRNDASLPAGYIYGILPFKAAKWMVGGTAGRER